MKCGTCNTERNLYYSAQFGYLCWDCYLKWKEHKTLAQKIVPEVEPDEISLGDTGQLTQEDMNDRP